MSFSPRNVAIGAGAVGAAALFFFAPAKTFQPNSVDRVGDRWQLGEHAPDTHQEIHRENSHPGDKPKPGSIPSNVRGVDSEHYKEHFGNQTQPQTGRIQPYTGK